MSRAKVKAGGIIRESLDNTWQTPPEILARVRLYFGGEIPFDAATARDNPTKALRFCAGIPGGLFAPAKDSGLTPDEILARSSGLDVDWPAPTWINPPYGESLESWLKKTLQQAARGVEVVALLPCSSRWENGYFLPSLISADVLCFHRGRIAFLSSKDGEPLDCNPGANLFAGWNTDLARFREAFGPLGKLVRFEALDGAFSPTETASESALHELDELGEAGA